MFQQVPVLKFQDENHLEANHMEMLDDLSDGLTPMEAPQFESFSDHQSIINNYSITQTIVN